MILTMKRRSRRSLNLRALVLLFYSVLILGCLGISLLYMRSETQEFTITTRQEEQHQVMLIQQIFDRPFKSGDMNQVQSAIDGLGVLAGRVEVTLVTPTGDILAHSVGKPIADSALVAQLRQKVLQSQRLETLPVRIPYFYYYGIPLVDSKGQVEAVLVTFSNWKTEYQEIQHHTQLLLWRIVWVAIALFLVLDKLINWAILSPVKNLVQLTRTVEKGDLSSRLRTLSNISELRSLGKAVNQMLDTLQTQQSELRQLNQGLEDRVQERTEALRQSEEKFRGAFETAAMGMCLVSPEGLFLQVNSSVCQMLGYSEQELLALTFQDITYPADLEVDLNYAQQVLAGEIPYFHMEKRYLHKNGRIIWALLSVSLVRDSQQRPLYFISQIQDISDRKQALEQLRWKEALLRSMTSASPLAFFVVDNRTDAILYFNHRFCEIWGIEHLEERMQQGILNNNDIIPDCLPVLKDLEAFAESCKPLQSEENRVVIEDEIPFVDGRTIRRFSAQIRDELDTYFGRLYIFEDISDRKQHQAALLQAKEAAEAANQAKSTFLANMSHELRTPLNGILGYAQILQREKDSTPKQKDGVAIIHQCGTHLLTLINDILDLSKIEANKLELYPEDFDFPSFLTGLSELFRIKAQQKEIQFTYLALNPLPTGIHADEKRLRQVLMNLLSNAVKFTDYGGVTFKVDVITHQSSLNDPGVMTNTKIRFQIEDTGIGMAPEQLEKIFLPFEQVGDSSRRVEGTGLGLAISQKIVSMMESKIFVESSPGIGSTFWFDLDLPEASNLIDSIPVKSPPNIIGYQGEKRKILIIDDCWENCSVIIAMLEAIGFEIQSAANGQEGLEKAVEFQPNLIITDLVMPVIDGFEMTRKLRELPAFQDTIILATSASVFEFHRQKSRESGCNDFLPKPIQAEELMQKIKEYLDLFWLYEVQDKVQTQESWEQSQEMVMPPVEELISLYEAAQIGHIERIKQEAIRLKQLDFKYTPFAAKIWQLAEDFDDEEVVNLVAHCLTDK